MALDKQIHIFSVDTGDFYTKREERLHWNIHKFRIEKNKVKTIVEKLTNQIKELGISDEDIKNETYNANSSEQEIIDKYVLYKKVLSHKSKKASLEKLKLQKLLENKVNQNISTNGKDHLRQLRVDKIDESKVISIFDSSLTRTIGVLPNELTKDILVVKIFYFDLAKDLLYYGFTFEGEKYKYFTSSAGQIRTKKAVFIKESTWNKYEKTLMCGLTINRINSTPVGKKINEETGEEIVLYGNNVNKHLAYMALTNSATDLWEDFDIDKSIVIPDFETDVLGTFDFINDVDYSITRKTDYGNIPHIDGSGMMLPCVSKKNFMVRLPWVKGLLGTFDFKKFINETKGASPIIKDIYGMEHNIIEEDIQIIFTASQFKMWKYYSSWDEYKDFFKKYNCTAGICNIEEDRIKNTHITYQMLQSITDITDKELEKLCSKSINKIKNLCENKDNMLNVMGVNVYNSHPTYFQQALKIYPNLLLDNFCKAKIRDIKDSLIKSYKAGALEINGKYTFVLPDFYAACEYWFCGINVPNGLLKDQEVYCKLFKHSEKLDCLRSPHLFREHAVRKNIAYKDDNNIGEWFTTNAIYTSTFDLISRVLQFDDH